MLVLIIYQEEITNNIIIAPHTVYTAENDLREAVVNNDAILNLQSNDNVLFVRPWVTIDEQRDDIHNLCKFARQMSTICEFPEYKQVKRIKQHLNACIRADIEIDDLTLEAIASDNNWDVNVLRLWKLVESIKMDMFAYIDAENTVECYIGEERCDHEGYVLHNKYGTFKLVNREGFSRANFNIVKNW